MPDTANSALSQWLRWPLLLATLAIALVNGQPFSPWFDPALYWLGKLVGRGLAGSPAVFHGTSVLVSLATLLVAMLPVLLLRMLAGRWIGPIVQAALWLIAATVIAWPALRIAAGFED